MPDISTFSALRGTRVALVTGASSGIGMAVARRLARTGWSTILLARREHLLQALAAELSPTAPSVALRADLSEPSAAADAAAAILDDLGPIDALVNNAGFGIYEPFLTHGLDDHRRLMQVNYFSPLSLINAFLPSMLARGVGRVVNVASMSAKMGPWGHSGYSASKAALRALTETLDAECSPRGVRCSCVFPGIIDTPYFHHGSMRRLFPQMRSRAISAERCAEVVCRTLERPRIWATVPAHYRLLDAMLACSAGFAHGVVARSSRPADEDGHERAALAPAAVHSVPTAQSPPRPAARRTGPPGEPD